MVLQHSIKLRSMVHCSLGVFFICLFVLRMTLPKESRGKICQFAGYEVRLHVFASWKCCVLCFPVCTAHRQTNQTCQHGTLPKSAAVMCPSGEKTLVKKTFASFAKPSSGSVRFLFLLLNCHFPQEAEALSSFVSVMSDNSRISPDLDEPEMHGSV